MILHLDIDGVCANLEQHLVDCDPEFNTREYATWTDKRDRFGEVIRANPSTFRHLALMDGCREAIAELKDLFTIFFLSAPMWDHPPSYTDKRLWLEETFGEWSEKKLILTSRKDLVIGDFLVDDNTWNGAGEFRGEHIHFGTERFPDWPAVTNYLKAKILT